MSTIEHLMGALFGLGIDNALIEIDNEEVPILDGSGKIFVDKIKNVGVNEIKVVLEGVKKVYKGYDKVIVFQPLMRV